MPCSVVHLPLNISKKYLETCVVESNTELIVMSKHITALKCVYMIRKKIYRQTLFLKMEASFVFEAKHLFITCIFGNRAPKAA